MSDIAKKNGLLYTNDFRTIVGVDNSSFEFKGQVPYGAKEIADKAFQGVNYESISLPDSVVSVGFNLFENAKKVKSIKLPDSLSELSPYMFAGCSSLVKVSMPSIVNEFPEYLFYGCSALQEVPFRTGISYIGTCAFAECTSIKSIVFPDSVQVVESGAFSDCESLESVVVGENVSEIAEDAFSGCSSLSHIRLNDSNEKFYIGENGSLYRKSDNQIVIEAHPSAKQPVSFYSAGFVEDMASSKDPVWIDEGDEEEEDDVFSAEIGAGNDEDFAFGVVEPPKEPVVVTEVPNEEIPQAPIEEIPPTPPATDFVETANEEITQTPIEETVSSPAEEVSSGAISEELVPPVVDSGETENGEIPQNPVEENVSYPIEETVSSPTAEVPVSESAEDFAPPPVENEVIEEEDDFNMEIGAGADEMASIYEEEPVIDTFVESEPIFAEEKLAIGVEDETDTEFSPSPPVVEDNEFDEPVPDENLPDEIEVEETPLVDDDIDEMPFEEEGITQNPIEEHIEEVETSSVVEDNIDVPFATVEVEKTFDNGYNEDTEQNEQGENMDNDDMLASIMEEQSTASNEGESVSVNVDELAGVVSAMNDSNGTYSEDVAAAKALERNINILRNSVKYSYVQDYETSGQPLTEPNLYVIAEKLVNDGVSEKLRACCEKVVNIHDFKRVIYMYGLPLENDEFAMFLTNVLNLQNVLVACEAANLSSLSDYCKQVCEIANIRLGKDDIISQTKKAGVKTQTIMKMVVQDKY